MKPKVSLVSLLLAVALIGTIVSLIITNNKNQSLIKQRDELLEESVRIEATDKSKIYVRRLPSGAPLVFRYQVAYPLEENWIVDISNGKIDRNNEIKTSSIMRGGIDLPYKPGESHKQGVVTIYINKLKDGYSYGISSMQNVYGGSVDPANTDWLDELAETPSFAIRNLAKNPVEEFSITDKVLLEELRQKDSYRKNGKKIAESGFIKIEFNAASRKSNGQNFQPKQ